MKPTFLLSLIIIAIPLLSQTISDITHDRMIADFDQYSGSINRYEDRLFVDNCGKIEEYQINPDGSLARLSFYESGYHCNISTLISEQKLYKFYQMDRHLYMMIFDLQSTPMEHISTLQVPFTQTYFNPFTPQEMGEYLLLSTSSNARTAWFHKPTLTFTPTSSGRLELYTVYYPYIITSVFDQSLMEYKLVFYNFETASPSAPYGNDVLELYCGISVYNPLRNVKMIGDYLYLMGDGFIKIMDLSDIHNITPMISITNGAGEYTDALLYGDLLIATTGTNYDGLLMYDIQDPANPVMIDYAEVHTDGVRTAMQIYNDKLYINAGTSLLEFDITNGLELVAQYGKPQSVYITSGEYLLENIGSTSQFLLYSMLEENPEILTFDINHPANTSKVLSFFIRNNLLFAIIYLDNGSNNIDVYDMNTQERLHRAYLSDIGWMDPFGDYIIVNHLVYGQPPENLVFTYEDTGLVYHGSFVGSLKADDPQNSDCSYFICFTSEGIEFRDKANPFNVLHIQPHLAINMNSITFHVGNIIGFRTGNSSTFRFWTWDEGFVNFRQTATLSVPSSLRLSFFNGILTVGDSEVSNKKFYTVTGGEPTLIGEMDAHLYGSNVILYPEACKMILRAVSGIHLYDFTYSVSESDVVTVPPASVNVSNYPNPFNPSTTISFTLPREADVVLDVYNIKGQKVRTLLDGACSGGYHQVVWNGDDSAGRSVGSGVYFYRMVSGGFTEVKKMLLLK